MAVADRLHESATTWLKGGAWLTEAPATDDGPGPPLLERYAAELGELLEPAEAVAPEELVEVPEPGNPGEPAATHA